MAGKTVTREVVLSGTLNPSTGEERSDQCPVTGKITQIIRHWPDGCNGLVDIAVGHEDTWVLPALTDVFVALNDATPVITVNEEVGRGEKLWAKVRNRDIANAHFYVVTFIVEGVLR